MMSLTTGHRSRLVLALLLGASLLFGACTTIQTARGGPGQRLDPWEGWNRKVFVFNTALDERIIKPVAIVYSNVVPRFMRRSVDNFFANARDAWSAVNNVLQGKGEAAFDDVVRVTTNSVLGFGGVLDIASEFGLRHHNEDFGLTLGHWGFGAGAYVVWPLFGPSSVRDSIALPLDRSASPALLIDDGSLQVGITVLQIVNVRAGLLGASQVLDDIALDKYTFVRDAYLQRRRSLIGEDGAQDDAYAPYEPASEAPAVAPSAR